MIQDWVGTFVGIGCARRYVMILFDEWGGFFDHVPPPLRQPIPSSDVAAGSDGRSGFRVPALIVSPFSQRNYVSYTLFDHTSVLKMIESRWNLDPLSVRDAGANSLALALNFSGPICLYGNSTFRWAPIRAYARRQSPVTYRTSEEAEWPAVQALAQQYNFPIYYSERNSRRWQLLLAVNLTALEIMR